MKSLKFLLPLFALAFMVACSSAPEGEKVETGDAQEESDAQGTSLAVSEGIINWVGSAPGKEHTGTLTVSNGELVLNGDQLVGGNFTIDMNSVVVTDLTPDKGKGDLEGHLMSADFFQAETYPTATFVITNVAPAEGRDDVSHIITGNITIKEQTKSVLIPAMVSITEGGIEAVSTRFTLDRTEFGITYNSGVIGTAKDKLINDQIALQINLKAAKPMM